MTDAEDITTGYTCSACNDHPTRESAANSEAYYGYSHGSPASVSPNTDSIDRKRLYA